jgi:hypothetical protein
MEQEEIKVATTSVNIALPLVSCSTEDISAPQDHPDIAGIPEHWSTLQFTWAGKSLSLEVADSDRYVCFTHIFMITEIRG